MLDGTGAASHKRAMAGRVLLLLLGVLASASSPAAAHCPRGTLTGYVTHVRDGDTIVVGSMPIRLKGLAAPEHDEPGGGEATAAMRALVAGKTLRCELDGEQTHDRCAGVCYLDGKDISATLVADGLARDCPHFSGGGTARSSSAPPHQGRRSDRRIACRGIAPNPNRVRVTASRIAARA
jgi:endonuclease YncB( thermonuclease family)